MRQVDPLEAAELIALTVVHDRRGPLAPAVDRQDGGLVERRAEERAAGVSVVMLWVVDPGTATPLLLEPEQVEHVPGRIVQLVDEKSSRVEGMTREVAESAPNVPERVGAP